MDVVAFSMAVRFPSVCILATRPSHRTAALFENKKKNSDQKRAKETFSHVAKEERDAITKALSTSGIVARDVPVALVMSVYKHEYHWHTIAVDIKTKCIWCFESLG